MRSGSRSTRDILLTVINVVHDDEGAYGRWAFGSGSVMVDVRMERNLALGGQVGRMNSATVQTRLKFDTFSKYQSAED